MEKQKLLEIVQDRINQSNDNLIKSMDFLTQKHEDVKNTILKLSYELDEVELMYNKLLEEFKNRKK